MPPQTRAAARRVMASMPLDTLPLPLALRIFALLPADARLLAAAVCRSWRGMLADSALWTRLDLSLASGVANPSDALLRAAAARAGGQLEFLRVSVRYGQPLDTLLTVLAANAGPLRELVLCTDDKDGSLPSPTIATLLHAAPGLRLLQAAVECRAAAALPMLRKEPPFGPLCLKRAQLLDEPPHPEGGDIAWRTLAASLAAHNSLEVVALESHWPQEQTEGDAVVGALLSLPLLRSLFVRRPFASVVTRLLGCPALTSLEVDSGRFNFNAFVNEPLLDSPASAAQLCDALRANTRLETLRFQSIELWRDVDAAAALLATLQAHPSLKNLVLWGNTVPLAHAAAAGAAIGAVIAHSPTLTMLNVAFCDLGDAGLGPIMDALPRARHLRTLNCQYNDITEAFARERLLPAVRGCASLRTMRTGFALPQEAEMLLRRRR